MASKTTNTVVTWGMVFIGALFVLPRVLSAMRVSNARVAAQTSPGYAAQAQAARAINTAGSAGNSYLSTLFRSLLGGSSSGQSQQRSASSGGGTSSPSSTFGGGNNQQQQQQQYALGPQIDLTNTPWNDPWNNYSDEYRDLYMQDVYGGGIPDPFPSNWLPEQMDPVGGDPFGGMSTDDWWNYTPMPEFGGDDPYADYNNGTGLFDPANFADGGGDSGGSYDYEFYY